MEGSHCEYCEIVSADKNWSAKSLLFCWGCLEALLGLSSGKRAAARFCSKSHQDRVIEGPSDEVSLHITRWAQDDCYSGRPEFKIYCKDRHALFLASFRRAAASANVWNVLSELALGYIIQDKQSWESQPSNIDESWMVAASCSLHSVLGLTLNCRLLSIDRLAKASNVIIRLLDNSKNVALCKVAYFIPLPDRSEFFLVFCHPKSHKSSEFKTPFSK